VFLAHGLVKKKREKKRKKEVKNSLEKWVGVKKKAKTAKSAKTDPKKVPEKGGF
jgi:hypothetical protein